MSQRCSSHWGLTVLIKQLMKKFKRCHNQRPCLPLTPGERANKKKHLNKLHYGPQCEETNLTRDPIKTKINLCMQSVQSSLSAWKKSLHFWLFKLRSAKILISLRECAGLSESSLSAHVLRYVSGRCGSYNSATSHGTKLLFSKWDDHKGGWERANTRTINHTGWNENKSSARGRHRWLSWMRVRLVISRMRVVRPPPGRQHSFVEVDHEIFSVVLLSVPLIQEG